MKNVFIALVLGCLIFAIWSLSEQEEQPKKGSKIENKMKQGQDSVQKESAKRAVRMDKEVKRASKPVSKSITRHKSVLESVEEEEAPIVPLERPDEMVYPPTREGINDVLVQFLPNIKDCYEQALEVQPDMEGRLAASFRIERPKDEEFDQDLARISEVEILDSDIDHEHFENCIMDNIDAFWFEPPEGEHIDVVYPFVFSAK